MTEGDSKGSDGKLVEGRDYTIDPETGYLIFTAFYHRQRGYCCGSGCRNCPYEGEAKNKKPKNP